MTGDLAAAIRSRLGSGPARRFVALAGPPGSGKSTLAEGLAKALGPGAAVLPMDGYHLDNAVLEARGQRSRKGAPWTFDTDGLTRDLARLRADDRAVLVPVFDRALDLARAAAREIGPPVRIVLVEGNYLLLDGPPWADLAPFWDLTIRLAVPEPVLEARLMARWLALGWSRDRARDWIRGNDLPNIRAVVAGSLQADFTVATG
ncbi:nucleoside/nucleotide kinase family protein [Pararhodobacter sp.]|uniref:nucleoside/nucleotide kinase family protein n=1 Tax=Pararhodobacter sp. TaxID=2127056 RepID=UPI002FE2E402